MNEEDSIKKEGARLFTRFFPLLAYGDFSRRSRAANCAVHGRIWLDFEPGRDLMVVLVTCKNKIDPIKNVGTRVFTSLNIYFAEVQAQIYLELVVVPVRSLGRNSVVNLRK